MEVTLHGHPLPEPVAVTNAICGHTGVPFLCNVLLENTEAELPTRRGLVHEMHVESFDEIPTNVHWEYEVDFLRQPKMIPSPTTLAP